MEQEVKQVAEDILIQKPKKQLVNIIFLLGSVIFIMGSALFLLKVKSDSQQKKDIEDIKITIGKLSNGLNEIGKVVTKGFEDQNRKTDDMIDDNDIQHKGINKKLEILKSGIDKNKRDQMDLIDEFLKGKPVSQIKKDITPLQRLESTYDKNITLSNEINLGIKLEQDQIKKKFQNL